MQGVQKGVLRALPVAERSPMKVLLSSVGKLVIRPYLQGDEKEILKLFKLVFGKEKGYHLWLWEFLQNPLGTQIMLGFLNGKLVAQCAGIPVHIYSRGQVLKASQVVDCMSHPKIRGVAVEKKGIFALVVEEFFRAYTGKRGSCFVYGFPSERHFLLGKRLLGYRKIRQISEIVVEHPRAGVHGAREVEGNKLKRAKSEVDRLALEDAGKLGLCILKHWEYFRWRYVLKPHCGYRFFVLEGPGGKIKALAVVKDEKNRFLVLDVLGLDRITEMVGAVVDKLKKPAVLWLPKGDRRAESLLEEGATEVPPSIPAVPCTVPFCEEYVSLKQLKEEFFYCAGDSDLF